VFARGGGGANTTHNRLRTVSVQDWLTSVNRALDY